MSVQVNQYLIIGVKKDFNWSKEWEKETGKDFYDTFEGFMDDSAFKKEINHKDGIFCLYDGMNGKYIIIGRVLAKGCDDYPFIADGEPMCFTQLSVLETELIENSIQRNFGIKEDLRHWLITHYR